MNDKNIDNFVAAPIAGDDGEAVEITSVERLPKPKEILEKPVDSGWFVAVVRCNCERKIAASIELDFSKNKTWLELWVPMQKVVYIEKRSNKRRTKEKPFLPTYIFCRVSKKHLNDIRFRSDVYKMLTMPGRREIYQVPDKELDDYRRLVENPDIPAVAYMGPLKKGQKVKITEGKLKGLEAYVQRISGKKALIGNEIRYVSGATIEINRAFLELVTDE